MKIKEQIDKILKVWHALSEREKAVSENHILQAQGFRKHDPEVLTEFWGCMKSKDSDAIVQYFSSFELKKADRFLNLFYDKLLESFLLDDILNIRGPFNLRYEIKYNVARNIIQIEYLFTKKLHAEASELLVKSLKLSIKFEHYDLVISLLIIKRQRLYLQMSKTEYDELKRNIVDYQYKLNALEKVTKCFTDYIYQNSRNQRIADAELVKALATTKYYKSRTKSVTILSYYYLLQVDLFNLNKNWIGKRQSLVKLIELIKKHKVLYSKQRLIILHRELLFCELCSFNFTNIEKTINTIRKFFKDAIADSYFPFLLLILDIYIIIGQMPKRASLIKEMNSLKHFEIDGYKFDYSQSLLLFENNEFYKSYRYLVQLNDLLRDKLGHNPWIRIYRILCLIELKEYEKVEKERESFRKFVERLEEGEQLSRRILTIITLFSILRKVGYQFSHPKIRTSKELARLSSLDEAYIWNPDSPELILIHDWLWAKIERRDYKPNLRVYEKVKLK